MPASYPAAVKSFTTKADNVDTIFADHVNDLQDEMVAVQNELGTDPAGGFATVKARIADLETGKSAVGHDHNSSYALKSTLTTKGDLYVRDGSALTRIGVGTNGQILTADSAQSVGIKWATPDSVVTDHGSLTGLADDDHTQYLNTARHDLTARHTAGTVVPVATPGSSAVGDAAAAGSSGSLARADHTHGREGFGSVTAETAFSGSSSNGAASTLARSDHQHGTPAHGTAQHGSGVVDHGAIGGLTDDDHALYQTWEEIVFAKEGNAEVKTGTMRKYFNQAVTILDVYAAVGTAPTGASLIVDVHKNGTTIFTTQTNRPTIAAGTNYDVSGTVNVTSVSAGQYLTVDIDQVGSTVAGADLSVVVRYKRA